MKTTTPLTVPLLCLLAAISLAADPPKTVTLTGKDLSAWKGDTGTWKVVGDAELGRENPKVLDTKEGNGAIYNGPKKTCDLFSKTKHGDAKVHVEFMVPKDSNSGVYLQGRYEVQILDSWGVKELRHGDCGGIYQRWKDGKGYEGHPPRVNASLPPGTWQTFDIVFRAPRFDKNGKKTENARFVRVIHNGKVVHENVEVTVPTRASHFSDEKPVDSLMLQGDHGPVAYRNIRITPLEQ